MTNPISYISSCLFVLVAHAAMLANIFINGNYDSVSDPIKVAAAVGLLDLAYFITVRLFDQTSYAVDLALILILNMGVIFQSSFGGVHFSGNALKHYITAIVSLISCRVAFLICRKYKWLQQKKMYIYIAIGICAVIILTLTGSRSMWISIGSMSIQPSELMKPLFILACATSVSEQQNKHKILFFNVAYENIILFGIMMGICLLQWWCRDLGSLPTFMGIYICGYLLRVCYPKTKFSKKTYIAGGSLLGIAAIIALRFAPSYVQDRLHADIWSDKNGNGYQQSQALIGIANGGWTGKGPGYGSLCNVFAHDNDIVFATVCEEWGLLYALMMIFAIIIMMAIPLIIPPRSYFHGTMAAGVCAAFTVQMSLNIFGSCNLIPFTGVTIPFISSGGTSMLVSGLMAGMLAASLSPSFEEAVPKKVRKPAKNTRRRSA
ncbi:MAG: FtsW/RodA/SpoVE family cell cycle protein [Ruminococcus sp.]|nr:FtsW/RodA/SpoVE family cell cycle protein [Ruminococcus sp.]